MKAVHFPCPKCQAGHSAPAASAGQLFVCNHCFGPILVPGARAARQSESVKPQMPPILEVEASPGPPRRLARTALIAAIAVVGLIATAEVVGSRLARRPKPITATGDGPVIAANQAKVETSPAPLPVEPNEPPPAVDAETIAAESAPVPATAPRVERSPSSGPDPDRKLVIRRRQTLGQDALRKQLAALPELAASEGTQVNLVALHKVPPAPMTHSPAAALTPADRLQLRRAAILRRDQRRAAPAEAPEPPAKPAMHVAKADPAPRGMLALISERQPELARLPWRMGDECHLEREAAEDLQVVSRALRTLLAKSTPVGDTRPDPDRLRASLLEEPIDEAAEPPVQKGQAGRRGPVPARFVAPAAIPALMQLLMAERTPAREVLIDVLARIPGAESARAIAHLAVFDLAPEVRDRAILVLWDRPARDYRPTLLEALRYPWAPIADHAAEALVALQDRQAVASLVGLLDEPDPQGPRTEIRQGQPVTVARSLVQVNHLQNCVLCHAPSAHPTMDLVRGRVPDETQPLPPPVAYYADSSPGLFVKAEVTYLRQDFSVTQPVENAGPWPSYQRYDYLISERPVAHSLADQRSGPTRTYPQRESVLFALRELTGKDLGADAESWKTFEAVPASSD